ncbi:MAG: GTP-binding protein [Nocardioides sp.]
MRATAGAGRSPVPSKIVVAGGRGAGKTTLVEAITELAPINPASGHSDARPPMALDFGRVTINQVLRLYLFGAPGDERYGFVLDRVLAGAAGGVVLVDHRRVGESFRVIDLFESRQLPLVIAVNQVWGSPTPDLQELQAELDVDADVPVLMVDVRDREAVKRLLLQLLDVVLYRALEAG